MLDSSKHLDYNNLYLIDRERNKMLEFIQYFVVLGCLFWLFTLTVVDVVDFVESKLKGE